MRNSIKRILSILPLWLCMVAYAHAQFYAPLVKNRPSGLNWQQLKTEHFRIIFPAGEDSLAFRSASILESQYLVTSKLTGGTLKNFPVVLNNYNDLSNGYVASLNFRSEIELPPLKGKEMNPQSGDWLETVLPHELVHATHINVQVPLSERKLNIPGAVAFLSPDMARTFHAFAPIGLHEGLAVYHESNAVAPGGGRGNYTHFNNKFNANFASPDRWNMGQTLISSDYSLPYNRHYISGYTFTDWLHENYGERASRDAIRFHYSYFFLGYGYSLRHVTGKWPGALYNEYMAEIKEEEEARKAEVKINTTQKSRILDAPFKGEQNRRPKWISDEKLLFFGNYYNGTFGFYTYNIITDSFRLLAEAFVVGDYNYELNSNGDELLFSGYKRAPLYSGTYLMDLFRLNTGSGESDQLTSWKRVYAPAGNGSRTLALQTYKASAQIVELVDGDSIKVLKRFNHATPVALKFNPKNPEELAVVMNRRGTQALWIVSLSTLSEDLEQEPILAFEDASVFDPEWHPNSRKFLFTLDAYPAMNVYEYDFSTEAITQVTSSIYNAYEASYSPDGNRIAYILQQGDEQRTAILNREDFAGITLSRTKILEGSKLEEAFTRPLLGEDILPEEEGWEVSGYKDDFSWLWPRMIFPVARDNSGSTQAGAALSSVDVLSSQGYYAEFTGLQNRLWYDITYTNKTFYPGFKLSAYSDPDFFRVNDPATDQAFSVMRQERGFSFSIPFSYTFRGDTRLTSLSVEPELELEQIKYYDLEPTAISDFTNRYQAGLYTQLNLGILSLPRDIQPSSGLVLFGFFDKTLDTPDVEIRTPGGATAGTTLSNQWSAYYGAFGYISPLRRWNQSLRVDLQFLQQSENPIYSTGTIVPMGFSENPFPTYVQDDVNNNLARVSTRYTIPLFYPDTGGLTVPFYLSSVYLTGFSHTLTNLSDNDLVESSRSIFGAGFHVQFKVSNLMFDLGVGFAFEPSRNQGQFFIGQF